MLLPLVCHLHHQEVYLLKTFLITLQNFIKEIDVFKNNRINSFLYLLVKYILFFFVLAFIKDRFKSRVTDVAETSSEMIKLALNYILFVLVYTIPLIAIFIIPFHFILKIKKGVHFMLSITLLFIIEYCFYTYMFASSNKILGIYNLIIGVLLLWIFFYKSILAKFRN